MAKEKEVINYEALSYDELSELSNEDHRKDTKEYDKQQNALALDYFKCLELLEL